MASAFVLVNFVREAASRVCAPQAYRTDNPLAISVAAVLPSSLPERSRHPVPSAFRSSIARPTDTPVYASSDISQCRLQDSRPGWIRCYLSCRALSSRTTCRFMPALSGLPTNRTEPGNNPS
jgi:hypothetical protein